jgi:uncharacterized membrane protein YsdA (DUF1294 family)/cold shock CspA family protein
MKLEIGKITSWKDDRGFGFITPKSGGKSIFIHINDFSKSHNRPTLDLDVTYNLSTDSKGRRCAINVSPKDGHKKATKADKQKMLSLILTTTFLCTVGGLIFFNRLPIIILGSYIFLSVIAFALYAKDKSAAQSGKWRTSESTLHLFSLIGGWPGAMLARSNLRHKSIKGSFRVVFWMTVIVNCGVLGWLLTSEGTLRLKMILKDINFG